MLADFQSKRALFNNFNIVAFTDNNPKVWHTKYLEIDVITPSDIKSTEFDLIIICSVYSEEIRKQLEKELFVDPSIIVSVADIEESVKRRLIQKYSAVKNREIREVIDYYKQNPLNIYGSYSAEKELYTVYRDQNQYPYILFGDKRMYFPADYPFLQADGRQFVPDILFEQKDGSPHQYVRNAEEIRDGSVIIDAGVCEGNFALQYIDKAEKLYLVEADEKWMHMLRLTFQPYRDKVVFCQKYLSRYDSVDTITVDTLTNVPVDFIKMDIEGAEVDALLGARKTLRKSNARCAICSYHKHSDEADIRFVLEASGYTTDVSQGYMFFLYDDDILDTMDLRKGIVYGRKK